MNEVKSQPINPEIQVLHKINLYRATIALSEVQTDQRLTRAARYWSALCQGQNAWQCDFATQEPWNALQTAPLEVHNAWILVSTTPPSVEASVAQWLEPNKERAVFLEFPKIGLALHRETTRWRWVIYSAQIIPARKVWW